MYRRIGFFEQDIVRKNSKNQNAVENSSSSENFEVVKVCILEPL